MVRGMEMKVIRNGFLFGFLVLTGIYLVATEAPKADRKAEGSGKRSTEQQQKGVQQAAAREVKRDKAVALDQAKGLRVAAPVQPAAERKAEGSGVVAATGVTRQAAERPAKKRSADSTVSGVEVAPTPDGIAKALSALADKAKSYPVVLKIVQGVKKSDIEALGKKETAPTAAQIIWDQLETIRKQANLPGEIGQALLPVEVALNQLKGPTKMAAARTAAMRK